MLQYKTITTSLMHEIKHLVECPSFSPLLKTRNTYGPLPKKLPGTDWAINEILCIPLS